MSVLRRVTVMPEEKKGVDDRMASRRVKTLRKIAMRAAKRLENQLRERENRSIENELKEESVHDLLSRIGREVRMEFAARDLVVYVSMAREESKFPFPIIRWSISIAT